jgi:tripartite-type tricarboxylate transporter receptor subunit TctC
LYVVHIPYKGTALAMPDLISGKIDVLFDSLPTGLPHVKEGRLRALGVTSAQRTSMAPGLPAIAEVLPGYESNTWFGLFGPAGVRPEIVNRVNAAALQALADPEVKDKLLRLGIEPIGTSPMQFATMLSAESAKWKKIISERKITLD